MVAAEKKLGKDAKETGSCCGMGNLADLANAAKTNYTNLAKKKPQTIKVTHVLKNGQRIVVDAELSEFTSADPENSYFPSTAADTPIPATVHTPLITLANAHNKEMSTKSS
ncbi:hypothetical protein HK100_000930 [Physocladia obscura]|uniref:Uncharacterized protein n=1 Tax=Physocladia obscura TaxID=109957 RepID=A0AAD5T0F6_9FUNG|nr:hypothetical protein HK100_000930 [Physocladia obscura]